MEPVNLIAIKSLKYAGTRLRPGDRFTATRAHAKAFVKALKKAKYADAPANAVPQVETVAIGETDTPNVAATDLIVDATQETYETKVEQPEPEPPARSRRHRSRT